MILLKKSGLIALADKTPKASLSFSNFPRPLKVLANLIAGSCNSP